MKFSHPLTRSGSVWLDDKAHDILVIVTTLELYATSPLSSGITGFLGLSQRLAALLEYLSNHVHRS
jgi:hypothetical protein